LLVEAQVVPRPSRRTSYLAFDVFLAPVTQGRAVNPKILSNQKEQMAYLFDLTLIALTGSSQNCYNELALLHITYS
jgi:hypothetical protein